MHIIKYKNMKQYVFATLCALLISFQLFSQNIVLPENMINFLKEDFNHEESCFPSLTTIDNYFIVNNGDASSADVLSLIDTARETVFNNHSINLELEVQILQSGVYG